MRFRVVYCLTLGLLIAAVCPHSVSAQDDQPQKKKFSSLLNIESLIDNYSRFLARKYDLNEEQDAYTQKLLREKAQKFLGQNEQEMFDLVDRMFEVRTGAQMDPAELVEWGKRVTPLYDQAKAIIVDGNNEWRGILNEKQRAMHDADLKLMEDSFRSTDDQIRRITQGEMSVDEFRNPARFQKQRNREAGTNPPPPPPQQPAHQATPPAPTAPPPGEHPMEPIPDQPPQKIGDGSESHDEAIRAEQIKEAAAAEADQQNEKPAEEAQPVQPVEQPAVEHQPQPTGDAAATHEQIRKAVEKKDGPPAKVGKNFEGEWEAYVRQFIEKYKLSPEQAQKAQDILKDCEQQAERHMKSRESRFNDLDKRDAALKASKDKNAPKEATKINDERQKLMAPIGDIFEKQLKPKLERLPTSKQRKEAEASAKKGAPATGSSAAKKPTAAGKTDPKKTPAAPPKPSDKQPGKGSATPPPAPQEEPPAEQGESKPEEAPQTEGGEEPK